MPPFAIGIGNGEDKPVDELHVAIVGVTPNDNGKGFCREGRD